MQLHQLRYVLAVAKAGSFSRAAEDLQLAQPSLSVQVRKLERELGAPLFHRLGRRVALTTAGEAFLEHAEPVLAHLEQARADITAIRNLDRGRIEIGALPSVGATLLPEVLVRCRRAHPGIDVGLAEGNVSAELERMVLAGRLDLAVLRTRRPRPGLSARVLLREPMVALLPPTHRLAGNAIVDLVQLAHEEFVGMHQGDGLRELMDQTCLRSGFRPSVTVETGQIAGLFGLVRSGIGVSVVPRLAAAGSELQAPLADRGCFRELSVAYRDGGWTAPAAAAFLDLLYVVAADWSGSDLLL